MTYSYDAAGNELTAGNSVGTYTMAHNALNQVSGVFKPCTLRRERVRKGPGQLLKEVDSREGVGKGRERTAVNIIFSATPCVKYG